MKRPYILYFAPGSGLGHLNRALAVCLELRDLGANAAIVTNSPFAEGLAPLAQLPFTCIAGELWERAAPAYLAREDPELVVLDTFPFGMRGEWVDFEFKAPVLYMARRLKVPAYREALPSLPEFSRFRRIIACESLTTDHDTLIASAEVVRLPGPIRLRPGVVATAAPARLGRIVNSRESCLVVHGGPVPEIHELLSHASGDIALITPWIGEDWPCPAFEYYPAANLFERAARVVSGAGYNTIADMLPYPERHTAIAFARRFDDQAGRLASPRPAEDGTRQAAELIAGLLQ
ncbi:MAG: hypothetical protein IT168_10890 [Bryobacterales bacterium]|nr:hypothetical protein [Bryobacterales bacterium]